MMVTPTERWAHGGAGQTLMARSRLRPRDGVLPTTGEITGVPRLGPQSDGLLLLALGSPRTGFAIAPTCFPSLWVCVRHGSMTQ
jgi:hypothetical protein